MSKAAATGVGLGLVRSSNQYSPVQTATASHDPIKYAKSFGDGNDNEYHYTDGSLWDCSIATSFGVLQTGFGHQQADDTCGHDDYYRHHITVWGAGFFTRTSDNSTFRSGQNLFHQYTNISTSANHCDPGPLLYSGNDGGNRFFSLRARNADPCPHEDQTPASRWFQENHKEGKDYDDYEDVDRWTDEWESEHPSDKDDFNSVKAANGIFGAVLGMYGAGLTTIGIASAAVVPVSLFTALSELGQGNGASISDDNREIEFWHDTGGGIVAHMIEFTALVPEGESFDVTVDMSIGIPEKSTCYEEPLRDNVANKQCINIHIPSNTESDNYDYYIYASECN
jgi:hypothetical protein